MGSSTALITGASAGLGREFARQFAARGINVVLVARRKEALQTLAAELRAAHNVDAEVIVADMSRADAPATLYRETRNLGRVIDYLVNNAGSEGPDLIRERDWQQHDAYLRLMMTSVAPCATSSFRPCSSAGSGV